MIRATAGRRKGPHMSFLGFRADTARRAEFDAAIVPMMGFLYHRALKLTGNANDAEDLLQDTCILGLRKWDMYQKGTNLKAWMARLQFNLYISQYRRRKARPDKGSIAEFEELITDRQHFDVRPELLDLDPAQLVQEETFLSELPKPLREGITEMDHRYRDVFLMSVVGEKSYKDIAEALRVPVGTVMSRLSRAKAFMRDFIGNELVAA